MELRKSKEISNNNPKVEKNSNIHKDHRSRLKLQFLHNGFESLTDVQKLETLLFYGIPQKDTNPIAHDLIDEFGSLQNVFSADTKSLMKIKGVKENVATLLKLVGGFITSCNKPSFEDAISSTQKAKDFCTKLYTGVGVEQFYVICLSKSNKIKKVKLLQSGTMDEVSIQIRNITELALESKCSRIIISHNHPSGLGKMSDEDCSFTYSLLCSCLLNSIDVIDHIIVGTDRTISLCEQKMMGKLREHAAKTVQLPKDQFKYLSSLSENYEIIEE